MKPSLLTCLFLLTILRLSSQNNAENYQIHIKKAIVDIKLDGVLDESAWQTGDEKANHFILSFPGKYRCKGALTGTIRPHDGMNLAGIHCKVKTLEYFLTLNTCMQVFNL